MTVRALLAAALGAVLAACASHPPKAAGAPFDAAAFFDGRAASRGTVTTALVFAEDFTAEFEGRREGGALLLDERFRFPEGRRLQRWRLVPDGNGGYQGTVETEGGNGALHAPVPVTGRPTAEGGLELAYRGYAPGGDLALGFRHRMVPQPDGTVLNRVRVSKFGIPVAGARVVFQRVPAPAK
ncbi:DUF3833 family protein [Aureimonas leprariae]|uniref:DUF3833 family protein n=1 Tax=Plantimonas leprariae TaxID=2615207 RepID=UPI001386B771|nr:DUF3833 family protein [Aureimonas leprariae]